MRKYLIYYNDIIVNIKKVLKTNPKSYQAKEQKIIHSKQIEQLEIFVGFQ